MPSPMSSTPWAAGCCAPSSPAPGVAVTDVVIAEPGDAAADLRRDLVIGAGVADATDAVELIELRRGWPVPPG